MTVIIGFIVVFALIFIGMFIFMAYSKKKNLAANEIYEQEHPLASKIYKPDGLEIMKDLVQVDILTLDEKEVEYNANKKGKRFVYVEAGTHIIEASASWDELRYKKTTTYTIDPEAFSIDIEPSTEYKLTYSKKEKKFSLKKI